MEEIVVAVIGGCGFLGQHIVKELQEWNNTIERRKSGSSANSRCLGNEDSDYVQVNLNSNDKDTLLDSDSELLDANEVETLDVKIKEIRILDIQPFKPVLEFAETPPIAYSYCDIRVESQTCESLREVDVVIHCAASILPSVGLKMANEEAVWDTNLEGTENVVWACKKGGARILIYTSTVCAVMGGKLIVSHTETLTPTVDEKKLLLGSYGRSRKRAEDLVLNSHKVTTDKDGTLLTTVLRPVALYGEGDARFIPSFIEMAKTAGGKLPPLGSPFAYHQLAYAGNVAVAHVCAMNQLLNQANIHPLRDCGGLPTYVSDDSPMGTSDQVLNPFLNNFGLTTTTPSFPIYFVLAFTFIFGLWVSLWEKLGWPSRWRKTLPSPQLQSLAGTTTVVSRTRAEIALGYTPKYSWDQSLTLSLKHYENLIEERMISITEN